MKVTSIPAKNYSVTSYKNTASMPQLNANNGVSKKDVSFGSLKTGLVDVFDFIERNGFFAEFLIVDTFSMIIPRILIGLNRDKEKTGKVNYKAGAEEAGREVISGPSMFLIPMGIMQLVKKLNPASKVPKGTMEQLISTTNDVVEKSQNTKAFNNKAQMSKNIADEVFNRAFGDFKLDDKEAFKTRFVEILNDESAKPKVKAEEFEKLILEINNKNKGTTAVNPRAFNISRGKDKMMANAKEFFEDFRHYSKDVVDKFSIKDFANNAAENCKKSATEFLEQIQKSRNFTRRLAAVTSYFAVGTFLLYLPKLYQQGKISPAQESAKRAASEGGVNENK